MNKIFGKILSKINTTWLLENTSKLLKIEQGQTFENYRKAAEFTAELIKNAGIEDYEIINFPADGKTVYQDFVMPLSWNASKGKLTILKSSLPFDDQVVADFTRNPFHLIKGSTATPSEGMQARIITESQLFNGEDAEGCLVITNPFTWPRKKILSAALDFGAIGIITDFLGSSRYDTPDGVSWTTACTEGNGWHVNTNDRSFIGFSVSPRVGDMLRMAAVSGDLVAKVECDGVRSEGKLPLVTALLPGKRKEELWVLSHLFEPLADDNSSGVVASIEMARIIKILVEYGEIPPLEFSLRLVFGMECYGFTAFTEKIGGNLRKKVIGAVNTDALPLTAEANFKIYLAPPGAPFFGNFQMAQLAEEYQKGTNPILNNIVEEGMYADDTLLSDSTIGIPTLWPIGPGKLWHNSEQKMSIIKPLNFSRIIAFIGTWATSVLILGEENLPEAVISASVIARKRLLGEADKIYESLSGGNSQVRTDMASEIREHMLYSLENARKGIEDFKRIANLPLIENEMNNLDLEVDALTAKLLDKLNHLISKPVVFPSEKWFNYAASITPSRIKRGFPHSLAAVPETERRELPDGVFYGPFARILANMDGSKNLQRLIQESEWETGKTLSEAQIKKYTTAISYLSDYGYLKTVFEKSLTEKNIVGTLHKLGIKPGDLLFVHSGLSPLGRIEGGAETIIDAIMSVIGDQGTALFPAFTMSFIYFDGMTMKNDRFRPYDHNDPSQVWVGDIPKTFLRRKGVIRSVHPTHSVAGLGPLAAECLLQHKEIDPPTCRNSPLGKLLEYQGKILYFGSGLAPTTFLHFLEDEMNLPYLGNAICRIKAQNSAFRTVIVPKHLPGHRDFYTQKAENCKFFKKIISNGLEIKSVHLGLEKLHLIDATQLYKLGIAAIQEDPNILLCDNPECLFCVKHKI